jgi:hypothetical protein
MTNTPELDAAILAAKRRISSFPELAVVSVGYRKYTQEVIAKLLDSLEEPAMPPVVAVQLMGSNAFSLGCKRTIAQLKRLAGIEEVDHGNS